MSVTRQNLTSDLNTPFQTALPLQGWITETQLHILTTVLAFALPFIAAFYVHKDYHAFLSLGPGGTPATPRGYLKIKILSIISMKDTSQPIPIPPHFRPLKGYFDEDTIPRRAGSRPEIAGIAPQRQRTQKSGEELYSLLADRIRALTQDPQNRLIESTSCFEKHSSGLFATVPIMGTCGGEIMHAHPSDGSMHMVMHPADANLLIARGWAERHPLAKGGWFRQFVPREFVLVYAPRNEEEVEIIEKCIAAAVWWVSGIDIHGDAEGPRRKSADFGAMARERQADECWSCKMKGCRVNTVEKMTG
ncbi:glutamate-1-semialdehyde -aminomutase [Pyrenophora seminiperda CCB06]|uniref:Glutamate-1-semialdehyde-aminomutase n=1 Tax=Pyrenophora seminiperda CCB06 TaxID=1302712 RepID=A0A3M7M3B5_9PLEO|nr:glutamate-1-semialdehyde -aminomutase [Pyrenophora seminiperda CCB06]